MLVVVTLGLHGLLLAGGQFGADTDAAPPLPAAVQVRTVVLQAPDVPATVVPAPVVEESVRSPKITAPKVVAKAPVAPAPAAPAVPDLPVLPVAAATPDPTLPADPTPSLPVAGDTDVPTYRTQLPPAATLRYELRRGILSGTGELHWKPDGERYELRLEGSIAGISILTQTSTGGVDETGIAPLRFVDQRRRDVRAANFQRDKRLITFSGPAVEYPLVPGSQDRLSWMIQLGAVVNAEPLRAAPGGKVAMFIVGARGDGDVWVFRFVASESVATEAGTVNAVKFTRQPRRPYDTLVEVWLDPQRHHLPVHARLSTAPDGSTFELLLRDMR